MQKAESSGFLLVYALAQEIYHIPKNCLLLSESKSRGGFILGLGVPRPLLRLCWNAKVQLRVDLHILLRLASRSEQIGCAYHRLRSLFK